MQSSRNIGLAIKTLSNQFHRYVTASGVESAATGMMTDIQGRILTYLHSRAEGTIVHQQEIEKHFNIRRSTATNILKRIERNGLVSRRPSPRDRRKKIVALTEKAKALCPMAESVILRAERQAARGLTEEELAFFFRIVDIMARNIA